MGLSLDSQLNILWPLKPDPLRVTDVSLPFKTFGKEATMSPSMEGWGCDKITHQMELAVLC